MEVDEIQNSSPYGGPPSFPPTKQHTLLYLEMPLPSMPKGDKKKNHLGKKSQGICRSIGPLEPPPSRDEHLKVSILFVCFGVIQSQKSSFYRERHPCQFHQNTSSKGFYFQVPNHERSRRFNRKDSHHQHFLDAFSTFSKFPFDSMFPCFTLKVPSRRSPSPRCSKDHRLSRNKLYRRRIRKRPSGFADTQG